MKPVRFLSIAREDLRESVAYFEAQERGLGADFFTEYRSAFDRIRSNPELHPIIAGPIRRCLFKRFKYAIFYVNDINTITVVAIIHLRRDPATWKFRR